MVTAVITESVPACFGIACEQHAQCKRYAAVEHRDALHFIATCDEMGTGERPLFIPIKSEAIAP
jgi:hypothetical protein